MNLENQTCKSTLIILTAMIIALGLAINGFFVGWFISKVKTSDRSVVVKGFAEKIVKSDWSELIITFKNPENDLAALKHKNDLDTKVVLNFLKSKGITESAITMDELELFDRTTKEYVSEHDKNEYRYILTTKLKVSTENIETIQQIYHQLSELMQQQISFTVRVSYYFTKFADLRPKMIAEATQSAREAAVQFAKDSGSKVGEIRNAFQGAFSISSPNEDYNENGSMYKKIRVVTTVTFNLKD